MMLSDSLFVRLSISLLFLAILVLSVKNLRLFILVYIALRSLITIFYKVNLVGGLSVLEFAGFIFPAIVLYHWAAKEKFKVLFPGYLRIYSLVLLWILFSNLTSIFNYGFRGLESLSSFFRILNGYSVFMVFPLIFKEQKDIDALINAFLFSTLFPLLQGLLQILFGPGILGMSTSISGGDQTDFVMYYGLYYKYDGYAWAALLGGLLLIYKISKVNSMKSASNAKSLIYIALLISFVTLASITLSRALFISLIIIMGFIFIELKRYQKIAFTIAILILIFIAGSFFQTRIKQLLQRSEYEIGVMRGEVPADYAFHGRMSLWRTSLKEFNKSPLLQRSIGTRVYVGPHSDYLQWLFSFGYVGLGLYIFLIVKIFIGCLSKMKKIKRKFSHSDSIAYGHMVIIGLILWIIEAFIHNPSYYPDYSYMIIGNAAIFLALEISSPKKMKGNLTTEFIA